MADQPKSPDAPPSETALLRYLIVSQVLHRERRGEVRALAVEATAALIHRAFDGGELKRSARTLYRWVEAFERLGVAGLEPAVRRRTSTSVVLPEDFLEFLRDQKETDVRASVPEVIRRARELGVVGSSERLDRTTVWRACRRMGLATRRRKGARDRDSRRFAYPHRMNMVLCDGKYFRAGVGRVRRVALFFLDDSSRYGLHVVVGTSENAAVFLRGLYESALHLAGAGLHQWGGRVWSFALSGLGGLARVGRQGSTPESGLGVPDRQASREPRRFVDPGSPDPRASRDTHGSVAKSATDRRGSKDARRFGTKMRGDLEHGGAAAAGRQRQGGRAAEGGGERPGTTRWSAPCVMLASDREVAVAAQPAACPHGVCPAHEGDISNMVAWTLTPEAGSSRDGRVPSCRRALFVLRRRSIPAGSAEPPSR